jgi:glycerophosphoryl diester phosphodiesterase
MPLGDNVNQSGLSVMGDRPRPYVMAHRGNSAHCPENTLAAFKRALTDGTDVIETDLHLSADGEFICIHDGTLERTTNGTGEVKNLTREQLQQYSASYGRSEFANERIPTLRQLLEILPPHVALALELKSDDFLDEQVCLRLQTLLSETETINRVVTLSFSRDRLQAIRRYTPQIPIGLITLFDLMPGTIGEMVGPWYPFMFANPFYVWIAHRRGQIVCPLDPTPEPRLWYYRLLRCDAVLTNDPDLTLRALGHK